MVDHSAWADWIRFARQQAEFAEVFRAMPIGLGACAVEDVVQKCPVEDCRRQRMIVFQKARNFRQDVPITAVPAVRASSRAGYRAASFLLAHRTVLYGNLMPVRHAEDMERSSLVRNIFSPESHEYRSGLR